MNTKNDCRLCAPIVGLCIMCLFETLTFKIHLNVFRWNLMTVEFWNLWKSLMLAPFLYNRFATKPRSHDMFTSVYSQAHYRGTSYLPGLLTGIYVYKYRSTTISKVYVRKYSLIYKNLAVKDNGNFIKFLYEFNFSLSINDLQFKLSEPYNLLTVMLKGKYWFQFEKLITKTSCELIA